MSTSRFTLQLKNVTEVFASFSGVEGICNCLHGGGRQVFVGRLPYKYIYAFSKVILHDV
jgi:hypothetical protein